MSEQTLSSLDHAYKTAIHRGTMSKAIRMLAVDGRLLGRCLDYGSGHGEDARSLGLEYYDPHFAPQMPAGKFDTITCSYVLNVIEDANVRRSILRVIYSRLEYSGRAYITVRTGKGDFIPPGAWQGLITLNLPIVHIAPYHTTYVLREECGSPECEMLVRDF